MAIETKADRFSMLNFGSTNTVLPPPDGEIDSGDKLSLLGLFRGLAAALPERLRPKRGPRHAKKQRLTPAMLDFEKVRLDRLAATEAKERHMLQARIGVEMAQRRTLVASMLNADAQQQARLRAQISAIEIRIKDLQQHLSRLRGGLHQ